MSLILKNAKLEKNEVKNTFNLKSDIRPILSYQLLHRCLVFSPTGLRLKIAGENTQQWLDGLT